MKIRFSRILALLSVPFLLTACPYQSKVPISEPNEPVDSDFYGEWVLASERENENPMFYDIGKHTDTKYKMVENRYNSSDSMYKQNVYYMHTSEVGNATFLNVQPGNGGDYYLYRAKLSANELTLKEVTEDIDEQFSSSKELEKFIKKYMDLSFFYEKDDKKYFKRTK